MTAGEPPDPETLPRDGRERLGQYWPTMVAIGAVSVIGGLSRGGACRAGDLGCAGFVGITLGVGFTLLAIGFWAIPGGETLGRRRSAARLLELDGLGSMVQTPLFVAKPIGTPQPSSRDDRAEGSEPLAPEPLTASGAGGPPTVPGVGGSEHRG